MQQEISNEDHNSKKRICIVRHLGYDLLARREAETLRDAGFDVSVVCLSPRSGKGPAVINGVRIHRVSLARHTGGVARYLLDYLPFFVLVFWKLTILHLQEPFACIQVNNMPDFLVFATLVPRILGSKVTMFMYEPTPELWATKYPTSRLLPLVTMVEQLCLRYAQAVFAVTEQMKQAFAARGADGNKISVILNATDSRLFDRHTAAEIGRTDNHFTLICHGAIEERYGHDTMLKAIARVRARIPGLQLRILGRGRYLDRLLSQIGELGLEDHVQYLGFVPRAEMVRELSNADVGIVAQKSSPYSNLIHTGKMYDYLSFGLPVIASRLKAVEAYFDADSVCFFEPDNAESLAECILDLWQHPERRRSLVANSQRLYEQYKWEQQKQVYLSVYRRLLG